MSRKAVIHALALALVDGSRLVRGRVPAAARVLVVEGGGGGRQAVKAGAETLARLPCRHKKAPDDAGAFELPMI